MIKFLFYLLVFCISLSYAQYNEEEPRADTRLNFQSSNPMICEVNSFWSNDTASIKLIITYRLNPTFLFFIKSSNEQQETYIAKGELGVEILNDKGIAVARDFRPIQIERNALPPEEALQSNGYEGFFIFTLKKGKYQIVIEAKDNASGKSFTNRNKKLDAQPFSSSDLNVSTPVFVEPPVQDTSKAGQSKYISINHGGNILIGQRGGCLFQVVSQDTITDLHILWKISSKERSEDADSQKFQGSSYIQESGIIAISEDKGHVVFFVTKDSMQSRVIYLPLPIERLEKGEYRLAANLTQGSKNTSKELTFDIIWPNEPRSLSNLNLAIEALKHIATEKEMNKMTTLNSRKAFKEFQEFWRKQSPDTTSAYNPRMAEYYRRVDEAIKRYSPKDEMDGYRTDRGRIFILFGSPSITNRLLKPNAPPAEIWTYENLKKQFTFVDRQRNGNYILEKEEKY